MSLCILIRTSFLQHLWLLVTKAFGIMVLRVAGKSKKCGKQTPTLEVGMYGFKGREELLGMKGYLYRHGNYQLVPVSSKSMWVVMWYITSTICHDFMLSS